MRVVVQRAAEDDILQQVEWYAQQGLPQIARRVPIAVGEAVSALSSMPGAGSPKMFANPALAGLRTWSVSGSPELQVYYLTTPGLIVIVRVLHAKRDVATLLEERER